MASGSLNFDMPISSSSHSSWFSETSLNNNISETSNKINNELCAKCQQTLTEPFIVCAECEDVFLCIECFRRGAQFETHKNDHKYKVHNSLFHLFDPNWTAQEEQLLLDLISKFGFGNWEEISRRLRTKSLEECKRHYEEYYIDRISHPNMPVLKPSNVPSFYVPEIPFMFKVDNCNDPPRYLPESANFQMTAGYRAARNDFDTPFDPSAESIISDINLDDFLDDDDDVDQQFTSELHCAVVRAYNNRLKERYRRYVIMRRFGLLMPRYTVGCINELNSILSLNGVGLAPYMQLMSANEFDMLFEGLLKERDLKNYLYSLIESRELGIKSLAGIKTYKKLKEMREKHQKHQTKVENAIIKKLYSENKSEIISDLVSNNVSRRKSVPLKIIGMPGYEILSPEERVLCAENRIMPNNFIAYRDILVAENQKIGSLKLAEARKLIKIDVNKTRKIYDYCLKEGFISNGK